MANRFNPYLDEEEQFDPYAPQNNMSQASRPSMSPDILSSLARNSPEDEDLVARYKAKMGGFDSSIEDAKSAQKMGGYADVIGRAATDFANAGQRDILYKNKLSNLGNKPEVGKAERNEWQSISPMFDKQLAAAKGDRADAENQFFTEDKLGQTSKARGMESSLKDPSSEDSISAREYLKQIAPEATNMSNFDRLSASQIQKIAPGLYKAYSDERTNVLQNDKLKAQLDSDERKTNSTLANDRKKSEKGDRDVTFRLSDRYNQDPTTKSTSEVRSSLGRAEELAKSPSATNDMGLVYSLMKSFDPGSTVREGEFAMAAKSGSLGDRYQAYAEMIASGKMTAEKRKEVLSTIRHQAAAQEQRQSQVDGYFSDQANQFGANPELVIGKKRSIQNAATDRAEKPGEDAASFNWDAEDKRRGLKK